MTKKNNLYLLGVENVEDDRDEQDYDDEIYDSLHDEWREQNAGRISDSGIRQWNAANKI